MTAEEKARILAQKISAEVTRGAGRGLNAAARFLAGRTKETLSVPAPRTRFQDPRTGAIFYLATSPAERGAPPRKLSSRLRTSITSEMTSPTSAVVGTNVIYARQLEFGGTIRPRKKKALRWFMPLPAPSIRKKPGFLFRPLFAQSVTQSPHPFLAPTAEQWRRAMGIIVGDEVRLSFTAA